MRSEVASLVARHGAIRLENAGSDADAIIAAVQPLFESRAGGCLFKLLGAVSYFWRDAYALGRHCFVCARVLPPLPPPLLLLDRAAGGTARLPAPLRTCRTDLCLYQQMQQPHFADVHTQLRAVGGEPCLRMLARMALAALGAKPGHIATLLKPLPPDYIAAGDAVTAASAAAAAAAPADVDTALLRADLVLLLAVAPGVLDAMPNNGRIADMLRAASLGAGTTALCASRGGCSACFRRRRRR